MFIIKVLENKRYLSVLELDRHAILYLTKTGCSVLITQPQP